MIGPSQGIIKQTNPRLSKPNIRYILILSSPPIGKLIIQKFKRISHKFKFAIWKALANWRISMAEQPRYEGTMHHCLQQKETSQGTKKDSSNYNHAKHSLRPASITNLTCSKKNKKNPTSSKLQQNHLKWPSNHNRCPSTLYSSVLNSTRTPQHKKP